MNSAPSALKLSHYAADVWRKVATLNSEVVPDNEMMYQVEVHLHLVSDH